MSAGAGVPFGPVRATALIVVVATFLLLISSATVGFAPAVGLAKAGPALGSLGVQPNYITRCPPACNASFNGSGIPSNDSYSVSVSGEDNGSLVSSVNGSVAFHHLDNGTYSYVVVGPVGYEVSNTTIANASVREVEKIPGGNGDNAGHFTIAGGGVNIGLKFVKAITHDLTVTESGLAAGTRWCALFSGAALLCSNVSSVRLGGVAPGYYTLTVPGVPGYVEVTAPVAVSLNSSSVTAHVRFAPVLYTVTFSASGLAPNTSWKVTLFWASGHPVVNHVRSRSTRGTTIVFDVPNGTYNYTLNTVAGYGLPTTPPVFVNGSAVLRDVHFGSIPSSVTFLEAGLATGSTWSITVGNQTMSTNGTSVTFSLPNGKYTYTVGAPAGYVGGHHGSGRFTVKGASVTVRVHFRLA